MNNDPVHQRLREISCRRALTETEKAELRDWAAAHPELAADIEADAALADALERLPDAAVPSNFTARVMAAIEREESPQSRTSSRSPSRWWRVFVPRFAVATVLIVSGTLGYRHHASVRQMEMTIAARQVAGAQTLADMTVIEDFETILNLNPTEATADESLLAMSDDLLALNR